MAYRNDVDALEARHRALEVELADRVRERDDVARMLAEARAQERDEQLRIDAVLGGPTQRRRWAMLVGAVLLLVTIAGAMTYRKTFRRSHYMHGVIERFQAFTDDVCRCSDTACTQRTIDAMTEWSTELARQRQIPVAADEDGTLHLQRISEQFTRCMARVATRAANATSVQAPQ